MPAMPELPTAPIERARWQRGLWVAGGLIALALGTVGIFLPLLPTTPFVLLAAWCFSNGSRRFEHWLMNHRHFGPMVRNWRSDRVIPLRAKQLASAMMTLASAWAWWVMPAQIGWLPAFVCTLVAAWMWQQPSRPREA